MKYLKGETMTVYTPSKSLTNFIKTIESGGFDTIKTFIITGKNGPTGKTHLANLLRKRGFNAIEIADDLLGYVSYIADRNHFILNQFGDAMTVILNEPLVKKKTE